MIKGWRNGKQIIAPAHALLTLFNLSSFPFLFLKKWNDGITHRDTQMLKREELLKNVRLTAQSKGSFRKSLNCERVFFLSFLFHQTKLVKSLWCEERVKFLEKARNVSFLCMTLANKTKMASMLICTQSFKEKKGTFRGYGDEDILVLMVMMQGYG